MLSDILRNKWFIGSFGLIIVFSLLCYFWYKHDVALFQQQLSSTNDMFLQDDISENPKETVKTDRQLLKYRNSVKNKSKSVRDTSVPTEKTTRQTDIYEKNTNINLTSDPQTSPFGFGPYPDVPADYKLPVQLHQENHTKRVLRQMHPTPKFIGM